MTMSRIIPTACLSLEILQNMILVILPIIIMKAPKMERKNTISDGRWKREFRRKFDIVRIAMITTQTIPHEFVITVRISSNFHDPSQLKISEGGMLKMKMLGFAVVAILHFQVGSGTDTRRGSEFVGCAITRVLLCRRDQIWIIDELT